MLPNWQFLLDRGVNFRSKRELRAAGFPVVNQLADVGLTGLATDPEIFAEAQHRGLTLITKDTDFLLQVRYALGHNGILYVTQSRSELQDTVTAVLDLASVRLARKCAHSYPGGWRCGASASSDNGTPPRHEEKRH